MENSCNYSQITQLIAVYLVLVHVFTVASHNHKRKLTLAT